MRSRIRPRLTYANVMSTLCLFILLGGGAYAATALPKDSVGTAQLKNKAVTPAKVASKTIQLLSAKKLTAREKSANIQGTCTPSSFGPGNYNCSGSGTVTARCRSGERATGGSVVSTSATPTDEGPSPASGTPVGWFASVSYNLVFTPTPVTSVPVKVHVVCLR